MCIRDRGELVNFNNKISKQGDIIWDQHVVCAVWLLEEEREEPKEEFIITDEEELEKQLLNVDLLDVDVQL